MDKNSTFWAEGTADEIGDLLALVIKGYLEKSTEEVAEAIGSKAATIEAAMEGKNAHGFSILKKTCEEYKLKFDIFISVK